MAIESVKECFAGALIDEKTGAESIKAFKSQA